MKVYIAYGWPEGNWHGKQLKSGLESSNYRMTDHPEEADAIIAHSAGCYMLPGNLTAKVILLIGLPHWPNKHLFKCSLEKIILEPKDIQWFHKTLWHVIYAVSQPARLYHVYKTFKIKKLPDNSDNRVVLIRNQQDSFMNDEASQKLAKQRKWHYKDLAGQHDDLWQNCQPYIDIINRFIALPTK